MRTEPDERGALPSFTRRENVRGLSGVRSGRGPTRQRLDLWLELEVGEASDDMGIPLRVDALENEKVGKFGVPLQRNMKIGAQNRMEKYNGERARIECTGASEAKTCRRRRGSEQVEGAMRGCRFTLGRNRDRPLAERGRASS